MGDNDRGHGVAPRPHAELELSRRDALKVLLASFSALQGACLEAPGQDVRPYVEMPRLPLQGEAARYATAMTVDGFSTGLLVQSHVGRPIKVDGHPLHPASLGATLPHHQASVYDLYDPHRAKNVMQRKMPASWDALAREVATLQGPLWLVLPHQSSPLLAELLGRIRERTPLEIVYDAPLSPLARYQGAALVFGKPFEVQLDLKRAKALVAFDADPLAGMPMSLRWARDFAAARRVSLPSDPMNRLYVAEPMFTATGSMADHRLALPASEVLALIVALSEQLRKAGRDTQPLPSALVEWSRSVISTPERKAWLRSVALELLEHPEQSAIVVGDRQPAVCHALVHGIQAALGAFGKTVTLIEPALLAPLGSRSLVDLAQAIDAKQVGALVALETNPVYSAAPELQLAKRISRVPWSLYAGSYRNETAETCAWFAPTSHYLESWGDGRAWDGTLSFTQPLIRPMYETKSVAEVLAMFAGIRNPQGLTLLKESFRARQGERETDARFETALGTGFIANSEISVEPRLMRESEALRRVLEGLSPAVRSDALELALARSPTLHDGRAASNGWLQELPHPITKLTWGNAVMMSPRTATRLAVADGHVLALTTAAGSVEAPALVVEGHADGSLTLEAGYGRFSAFEPLSDGLGANAFALTTAEGVSILDAVKITRTGSLAALARTQEHFDDEGRQIAQAASLAHFRAHPKAIQEARPSLPSLMDKGLEIGLQWAMTIDLTICTGCSSCVVACQAENNVPMVGREGVLQKRVMHWLRLDSYRLYGEAGEGSGLVHQPMLCQHCEKAPCEYVCPVFATTHSPDGLNEMVYNRCIGTRFCSNNCPYKVRRFNWFNYTSNSGSLSLQRNPQVTVRDRGVMEKCTYCVQRIRAAEIQARMGKRPIRPGEVTTACQDACPTRAIQFGALQHEETPMVQWRREARTYAALEDLHTVPRTLYLAKLKNPRPEPEERARDE